MTVAGYRLVEKDDFIRDGDVAGWARKYPIDMNLWKGSKAAEYGQPVFRPLPMPQRRFVPAGRTSLLPVVVRP